MLVEIRPGPTSPLAPSEILPFSGRRAYDLFLTRRGEVEDPPGRGDLIFGATSFFLVPIILGPFNFGGLGLGPLGPAPPIAPPEEARLWHVAVFLQAPCFFSVISLPPPSLGFMMGIIKVRNNNMGLGCSVSVSSLEVAPHKLTRSITGKGNFFIDSLVRSL